MQNTYITRIISIVIPFLLVLTFLVFVPTVSAGPGDSVIGEMGVVVIEQMQWHNITFRNGPYDSIPVVIASPTTNNRGAGQEEDDCCGINDGDSRADDACDGIIPVINWVGTTGFNCTIMYDNGTSSKPPVGSEPGVTDNLSYWVINTSAITNYDWIDAGVKDDVSSGLTGDNTDSISFGKTLSGDAAVFLCPQTYRQGGNLPAYYWGAAAASGTAATFQGGVHYSTDDCNSGSGHEDVGWVAIDLDECLLEDFEYGSAVISNSAWTSFSHSATEPMVLVMQNSDAGSQDPQYCQARDLYNTPEFRYNEQDGDGVSNSHNGETVYWVCLDNTTDNGNITAPNPLDTSVDQITPYDTSTNPLTITATSIGGAPSNVTLYYRYNETNTSWGSNYEQTILNLSPDYWWKLDGDETDSADGADSNGGIDPDWVDPIVPGSSATYCGDYNGDDTDIPNQGDINDGTTYDRSMSVWFIADTIDTTSNGRAIWEEGGSTNSIVLYVHEEAGEDRLYFVIGESANIDTMYYPISEGVLYHVGIWVDYSEEEMHMYLNGTEVANKTGGFNTGTSLSSHTGTPCIGDSDGDGWDELQVTGNFDGRIQDMIYWGDESPLLTGSDFEDIYNAGITAGIPWVEWSDASNPDLSSPWSWNFNFPNGTGYYEFYSIAKSAIETEIAPSEPDAICNYTSLENSAPELINPQVEPTTGVDSYTLFYFNITWVDSDGDDPTDGYLKVNISKSDWYTNQSLSWISGDNTTGANYSYSTTLTIGSDYIYQFFAYDGTNYNSTISYDNPDVSAQSLSFSVVTPSTGDYLHFNEWTLSITGVGLTTKYNVSEDNQTSETPSFNISNTGNVPLNFSINWSGNPGSGITMKWATSDIAPNPGVADIAIDPSTTQIVTNLLPTESEEIWLWMDFVSVTAQSSSESVKIWSELYND